MIVLAGFVLIVHAAEKEKFESLPEPPPPVKNYKAPPKPPGETATDNEALPEPEVHITTQGDERREEYRMSGKLYIIKVIPKGPPYYLIDKEGKGEFVKSDLEQELSTPMWVITSF